MKKNITIIYGSPRKNGNSDKLGQAFAKGANMSNHSVSEFYLRDLKVNGCIGCEFCYENFGECSQKDDMVSISKRLYETDILVLVTPIYYQSFTAQLKSFIDRLYISENKPLPISGAILLASYATPGEEMSLVTKMYFDTLLDYHDWKNLGNLFVSGMDDKNDIDNHTILEEAFLLGKNV